MQNMFVMLLNLRCFSQCTNLTAISYFLHVRVHCSRDVKIVDVPLKLRLYSKLKRLDYSKKLKRAILHCIGRNNLNPTNIVHACGSTNALSVAPFFMPYADKRASGSCDGERLPPPMDIYHTTCKCVASL